MNGPGTVLLLFLLAVLLAGAYQLTAGSWAMNRNRARAMRWRIRMHRRPGPGWASMAELAIHWSRLAAVRHGKRARLSLSLRRRLFSPATTYAIRLGRAQWFKRVFARIEDMILLIGGPRSGKTGALAEWITTWPGAVLCTSTRADLYMLTAGIRKLLGRIHIFNPLGVGPRGAGRIASTFGWDILRGCDDVWNACRRSMDLTGEYYEQGDMAFWQNKAAVALSGYLYAAAVSGMPIGVLYAWAVARDGSDYSALEELESRADPRGAPDAQAAHIFASVIREIRVPGRSSDSIRMTLANALNWVSVPALLSAVSGPGPDGWFDPAEFAASSDSLYLIAKDDGHSPVAPLYRALAGEIHFQAAMAASAKPGGKLDPPMLFGLDEVHGLRVPVNRWVADSAGNGMCIIVVAQSLGQLEQGWGKAGATTIWDCCLTKFVLPGNHSTELLERMERLSGKVGIGEERKERAPAAPEDAIRKLPRWHAMVLCTNLSPVAVRFRPVFHRWRSRLGMMPPLPAPAARAPARWLRPGEEPRLTLPLPRQAPENGNGHRTREDRTEAES